jgi:plasmid maintenance system antidote protein VapI
MKLNKQKVIILRNKKEWSPTQLAAEVGVSVDYINKLYSGARSASDDVKLSLIKALGSKDIFEEEK